MIFTPSVEEVHQSILLGTCKAGHLIGVDGFMEAGKTPFANRLASRLSGTPLSLDSYSTPEASLPKRYLARQRVNDFQSALRRASAAPFVVVEGVCLLEVLDAIGAQLDTHIYLKRVSRAGIWHDGVILTEYASTGHAELSDDWLRRDILRYHCERGPHESASILVEWSE